MRTPYWGFPLCDEAGSQILIAPRIIHQAQEYTADYQLNLSGN